MQTLFTPVKSQSTANVRHPRARVRVSWKKIASSGVLATVGTSLVNGLDIVAGAEGVALPWDAYQYYDETENVLGFEYDRELIEPQGGIAAARANVILDNTNRRYSPNYNQTVGTALGPDRPLLIDAGFHLGTDRTIPVFKGSTFGDPKIDHLNKVAEFRAADIISLLEDASLSAAVYTDQRSDQILADILANAGVGTSQYELDVGLNTIPFAWFPADMNALTRIAKICEAEEASFYQDERGKIRFEIRLHYKKFPHNTSQITLEKDDFVNFARIQNTRIINRCVVKASPREVDVANAAIWQEPVEVEVEGNSSKTIWSHPTEPDSSVPILVYSNLAPAATTDYRAYTEPGGAGVEITGDQTVTLTNFVDAQKIVLQNGNAAKAYYNVLQFRGKAARVKKAIKAISEDSASQTKYGVKEHVVGNDFIQTLDWAESLADDYIAKYKDPTNKIEIAIPALPHLQLKDRVTIRDPDIERTANGAPISLLFDDSVFDFVAIASDPSLDLSGAEFTQELWAYSLVTDQAYHGMLGYGQGAVEDRYPSLWIYEGGKLHFGFGDGTDWHGYFTNPVLGYKKWMHIAATFDGTDYKLFVNGIERYSTNAVAGKIPTAGTTQFDVGRVDNYFPGRITEVRIWNKRLYPGDIRKHFLDAADISTNFTGGVTYAANCVCHLPMQKNSGLTVFDKSGNNNNGIFSGGIPAWYEPPALEKDYRVMKIAGKFLAGGFTQDVILREIDSSETAT